MYSACEIVLNLNTSKSKADEDMAPTTWPHSVNNCSLPGQASKDNHGRNSDCSNFMLQDKSAYYLRSSQNWSASKGSRAANKVSNPVGQWKQTKKVRDCGSAFPSVRERETGASPRPEELKLCPLRTAFEPSTDELKRMSTSCLTDENMFRTSQLVPRSFLSDPLWSQLVPNNFFIRALPTTPLACPATMAFTLQPQPGKILFRPIHFVVAVTGPNNLAVPLRMHIHKNDQGKELMYVFYFRPEQTGAYTAKVRLAANGIPHVCQSPLTFYVDEFSDNSCIVETEVHFSNNFLPRRTSSLSSVSSYSSNSMETQ